MIFHDVQQNTDEWMALRLGKATASNFACIMANDGKAFGDPAKRYALQLALELITGEKDDNGFSNEHTERGHEQEPIARMLYEDENFVEVSNGGFFDWGTYGDSPDGLVMSDGVIEIKCVIPSTHYATIVRQSFDPAYRWQLIGHLNCTGRDWVDFVSYCQQFPVDKRLIVNRLVADECKDDIKRLEERRAKFIELVSETVKNIREL